jgi:DNA-binding beta-propeller fold protein YncE
MKTHVHPQTAAGKLSKPQGNQERLGVAITLVALIALLFSASPALAAEPHPLVSSFGRTPSEPFTNPNGIAVEESTGDVYVADIGTNTVYKFDASGTPVDYPALGTNALTGTPTGSFSFPEDPDTPAQVAVDNSTEPSDPSRGDLYVMDAGHDAIDKFSPSGAYISQIT